MKIHRLIALITLSSAVFGCSNAPVRETSQAVVVTPAIVQAQENASSEMAKIIDQFQQTQDKEQLQISLLELADAYQRNADCLSTNIVVQHALPLLSNDELLAKANILRSECAIYLSEGLQVSEIDATSASLERVSVTTAVSNWVEDVDSNQFETPWASRFDFVQAYLYSQRGEYQAALDSLLMMTTVPSILEPLIPNISFDWLGRLPFEQRMSIVEQHPSLYKYQRLFSIIEDLSIDDMERQRQLQALLEYDAQTLNEFVPLPLQVKQFLRLDLDKQKQIAILLPLSGRLASQGEAIKQGMLASYYQQLLDTSNNRQASLDGDNSTFAGSNLVFIDTGSKNELPSSISQESLQNYSTIVGPLLKSHIETIQNLPLENTLRIHLNQLDQNTLTAFPSNAATTSFAHFFALSPEQEAESLANQMIAQDILHPVLIYDDSAVTKRMADAFLSVWRSKHDSRVTTSPSEVIYSDNKSMRAGITSALDVLQSQQRINQMSNLVNERVFSVTRNRRDVDAFVVFAGPNEVELINPIIESSISLFSEQQVPVFATSYSYNHKQNKNTLRDLRNLVFVDMPFVLPEGRQSNLAQEVDMLFNLPSSTYLRLFAFGYDAITLSQHVLKLRTFGQLRLPGLTGVLSVDHNGQVKRQLSTLAIDSDS